MPQNAIKPCLQQCATPMALLDRDLLFRFLNPAFSEVLDLGSRRLLGQSLDRLACSEPRLYTLAVEAWRSGQPGVLREVRIALPGGADLEADLFLSRIDDSGGDAQLLLELHPRSESRGQAATLGQALRVLAHELRNPLGGVRGAAQLLARPLADERRYALSELIVRECDRLVGLLERVLQPPAPTPRRRFNPHQPLDQAASLIEAEQAGRVRLLRDYDPSLPDMEGDPDRVQQALLNLLHNATQAGAETITLRTRLVHSARIHERRHRAALRIEIIDNGSGVPETLGAQVFLPLVSGRPEGTGLGLAQARRIAEEHAGSLSFASRPGRTVFTLLLPLPDA